MAAIPWRPFNLRGIKMKGLLSLLIFLWSFLHMPELLSTGRALFTRQKIKKWWCSWWTRKPFFAAAGVDWWWRYVITTRKIQVPFMLTPPVAKIGANSGQQVKIKIMSNKLPTNKESIFIWMFWIFHQIVQSKKVRMHWSLRCKTELSCFTGQRVLLR